MRYRGRGQREGYSERWRDVVRDGGRERRDGGEGRDGWREG